MMWRSWRLSRYERVSTWLCAARVSLELMDVPRSPVGARGMRPANVRNVVRERMLRRKAWRQLSQAGGDPASPPDPTDGNR